MHACTLFFIIQLPVKGLLNKWAVKRWKAEVYKLTALEVTFFFQTLTESCLIEAPFILVFKLKYQQFSVRI